MLLLCGFAAGFHKTWWHGCAQQSISDAATLLTSGLHLKAAKRLETAAGKVGLGLSDLVLLLCFAALQLEVA